MMNVLLYVISYGSILVFLIACIVRVLLYARPPIHLRWELYPIPHEHPDRVGHGGSYYEEPEWWTKPTSRNTIGELKCMAAEIFFLKALWEFNRKLWYRSFPFHFGLYLLIFSVFILFICGVISIISPVFMKGILGAGLQSLYRYTGVAGLALSIWGALGLLVLRTTDSRMKGYKTFGDIFNLVFFIVAFGMLAAGCIVNSGPASGLLAFTKGLLSFDTGLEITGLFSTGLILTGLLTAYIPMTHMSHFIAKYFTYHNIRWDDASNRRGGKIEARLAECLSFRPTWSAKHMGADGKKTWADIAASSPVQESKK
jgi:nitrate reductase gamma subunit